MKVSYGVLLKLGSTLSFSLMYAAVKLAGHVPVGEVIFFRCFFALVPLFALSFFTTGPHAVIRTSRPLFHVLRSAAGTGAMFLNFAALALLPLADLTAFSFVAPIFAVVLAAVLLHESVGAFRWGAVLMGFAGVLVMIQPHGGLVRIAARGFSIGAGLALLAALLTALVVVFIRQMSATERSETIVFYFMATCSVAGAVTIPFSHVTLSETQIAWLICSGLVGGIAQILMTYCYRYAEPSLLAPFDYMAMLWAAALGYLIFEEVPEAGVMAGAGVVIAAGLFIVWHERHILRERRMRTV